MYIPLTVDPGRTNKVHSGSVDLVTTSGTVKPQKLLYLPVQEQLSLPPRLDCCDADKNACVQPFGRDENDRAAPLNASRFSKIK